jgi:choice-of-anchor B domain-containing protein
MSALVLRGGAVAAGLLIGAVLLPASASAHWNLAAGGWGVGGMLGWGGASVLEAEADSVAELPRVGHKPCVHGYAGPFRCQMADLRSFLPMSEIGGGPGSIYGAPGYDVWGWTDPETGTEWVIAGRSNGTSFIDMDDPKNPVFVANLPSHGVTELHSFAYAVGATRDVLGVPPCHGGGLHMVDIRDPKSPTYAGCFDDDGYTHDVQCVIYHGPDERYQGRELCFAANPSSPGVVDALTIVDVTDKANPVLVGKVFEGEPNTYSHQGWLTEDHRYFLHDDESDNGSSSSAIQGRSRNRVFDVTDLQNPVLQSVYHGETRAPLHNLYVRGRYMYNANYIDGLRIVDIRNIDHPGDVFAPETPSAPDHQGLREVACFDTDPFRDDMGVFPNGRTAWGGSWSNYPYFKSSVVVVSGFDGLFLVKPRLGLTAAFPPAAGKNPPNGNAGGNRAYTACLPS